MIVALSAFLMSATGQIIEQQGRHDQAGRGGSWPRESSVGHAAPMIDGLSVQKTPAGHPVLVEDRMSVATSSPPIDDAEPDIVVTGGRHPVLDPMRGANAISSDVAQVADKALLGPISMGYRRVVPSPIRDGLGNALANLREPVVAIAFLLQMKPGKSAETLGRLAVNTTIGVGGLFDIAKRRPFNLPRRRNGLADTLGYYGVGPGPFLFLPLVGPTTVRDFAGDAVDRLFLPVAIGRPFNRRAFTLPANLLRTLDHRAEFDDQLHSLRDDAPDSYVALRDYYLRRRQAEIDGLREERARFHGRIRPSTLLSDGQASAQSDASTKSVIEPIALSLPTG